MKKILIILAGLIPLLAFGQQFPFMEGYSLNPFSLSPSYAGLYNNKTVFMDYRSDWKGFEGGPRTYQLSYSDRFSDKVGIGGRFLFDKTDIFKQTLLMGTYTYEVKVADRHLFNFGLSAGFFRNSIDLSKYYNNPDYVQDMVLVYGQENSKFKVTTDISALYRYKDAEVGVLFSNLMFGTIKYRNSDMTYKPLKNYLIHATYLYNLDERWAIKPTVIFRGGQNVPKQLEISPTIIWDKKFWGTCVIRTGGIFGFGLGGEVYQGILVNYNYNMSTDVTNNIFGSHQISLGVRLPDFINYGKKL